MIRPLEPKRKPQQTQRSSPGIPPRKRVTEIRPTGFGNTGSDCYMLSLFHLLTRNAACTHATDLLHTTLQPPNGVVNILKDFEWYRRERYEAAFPHMGGELYGVLFSNAFVDYHTSDAGLIDDHESRQQDPVELLSQVLPYLDNLGEGPPFSDAFGYCITHLNEGRQDQSTALSPILMVHAALLGEGPV